MAVSPIGGSGGQALAALQRQLLIDQRQLSTDVAARRAQPVLAADQAKIGLDQAQLAATRQDASIDLYL